MNARILLALAVLLCIISPVYPYSFVPDVEKAGPYVEGGLKGQFTTGENKSDIHYKPFGTIGYNFIYMSAYLDFMPHLDYQVVDGEDKEESLNMYMIDFQLNILFIESLIFTWEYNFCRDYFQDSGYESGAWGVFVRYNFSKVFIAGDFGEKNTAYDSRTGRMSESNFNFTLEGGYRVSDLSEVSCSFTRDVWDFKTIGKIYEINAARIGGILGLADYFFLTAGVLVGVNSDGDSVAGVDAGFGSWILEHLKIDFFYGMSNGYGREHSGISRFVSSLHAISFTVSWVY